MGERKTASDASILDVLGRLARGVIVDSALPVSPVVDGLRRVEGPEAQATSQPTPTESADGEPRGDSVSRRADAHPDGSGDEPPEGTGYLARPEEEVAPFDSQ